MTVGEKIYKLRLYSGLSQKDFADKVGTSQSAINYWENGKRQPRVAQIKKIAKVFNFPLYDLLDDSIELGNIELEMRRVKPYKSYEMVEPPGPFTVPLSQYNNGNNIYKNLHEIALQKEHQEDESEEISTVHKYDAPIRVNLTPEKIEYLKEINRIYKKIENKENLTKDELQILKDDNERQRTAMERLQETLRTMQEKLIPAYEKLNKTGQEEAAKRVEELTEISRYTKSDEPPQE